MLKPLPGPEAESQIQTFPGEEMAGRPRVYQACDGPWIEAFYRLLLLAKYAFDPDPAPLRRGRNGEPHGFVHSFQETYGAHISVDHFTVP